MDENVKMLKAMSMSFEDAMLVGRCLMDYTLLIDEKKTDHDFSEDELDRLHDITIIFNLSIMKVMIRAEREKRADAEA